MKRLVAFLACLALAGTAAAAPPTCDRACLEGLANRLVDALATRGASAALPWAARVRYSENAVPMMVDDGIWATVTAHGPTPLIVADPALHQLLWMGEIEEHGQPAFLALRLRADGATIAEVQAVIRRKEGRPPFADPAAIAFAQIAAPAMHGTRARLLAAAQGYYAPGAAPRVAAGCVHTDNGVTLPRGCAPLAGVEAVRGLRVVAVDEARGLVAVTGTRDFAGVPTANGGAPADAPFPHSYVFAAVLRIGDGGVTAIQEVSSAVPYRMPVPDARP